MKAQIEKTNLTISIATHHHIASPQKLSISKAYKNKFQLKTTASHQTIDKHPSTLVVCSIINSEFVCLLFNGSFSTNRLYYYYKCRD